MMTVKANELRHLKDGMYSAVDDVGNPVIIMRQKGLGWSVSRATHNGWFETVDYSEQGDVEGVHYGK